MNPDVLVVGAGPAGAIAALALARSGLRVRVLDRATFPREKLCGDSLNPGAMALLDRHGLRGAIDGLGLPVEGMLVTGPRGVQVAGRYPQGLLGRSLARYDLDVVLVSAAERAGAGVELGVKVAGPLLEHDVGGTRVAGVIVSSRSGVSTEHRARVVIAADGRRSPLALALGLARQPRRPRRWALGAYYEGVSGVSSLGEMHVRSGHYIGVAAVPGGRTNVCLVVSEDRAPQAMRSPALAIEAAVTCDDLLRDRFRGARRASEVRILGPLAIDANAAGTRGLLLAGDAAGFIDPMTGDGMRIAMRGAELAAAAAGRALAGQEDAHVALGAERARQFGTKLRVNRVLRGVVAAPLAIAGAAAVSALAPLVLERLIAYSGDVGLTSSDRPASAGSAI